MEERATQRAERRRKLEEAKQRREEEKLVRQVENEIKSLSHHSSYKKCCFNPRVRDQEKALYPKQEFHSCEKADVRHT